MLWDTLSTALREIHCKNASKLSFEQLYRASYKIVLKKQGEMLYDRVKAYEEQWFGTEVMPPIRSLITNNLVNVTMGGVVSTTPNEVCTLPFHHIHGKYHYLVHLEAIRTDL